VRLLGHLGGSRGGGLSLVLFRGGWGPSAFFVLFGGVGKGKQNGGFLFFF